MMRTKYTFLQASCEHSPCPRIFMVLVNMLKNVENMLKTYQSCLKACTCQTWYVMVQHRQVIAKGGVVFFPESINRRTPALDVQKHLPFLLGVHIGKNINGIQLVQKILTFKVCPDSTSKYDRQKTIRAQEVLEGGFGYTCSFNPKSYQAIPSTSTYVTLLNFPKTAGSFKKGHLKMETMYIQLIITYPTSRLSIPQSIVTKRFSNSRP